MVYVGIDPGKNGGIAAISDGGAVRLFTLPKIGNDIDITALCKIFNIMRDHMVTSGMEYRGAIEQVHSIHGSSASSNFEFGESVGLLRMGMAMTGMGWEPVQPKAWQKILFEGIPPMTYRDKDGKEKKDTKAMAHTAISRLYPNASFLPTPRSSKPHEGMVDALCIAHYARIKYQK